MNSPELIGNSMHKGLVGIVQAVNAGARTRNDIRTLLRIVTQHEWEQQPTQFEHYIDACISLALAIRLLVDDTVAPNGSLRYKLAEPSSKATPLSNDVN